MLTMKAQPRPAAQAGRFDAADATPGPRVDLEHGVGSALEFEPGAWLLRAFALDEVPDLLSDRSGYRYDALDPLTGECWPPMPDAFATLAARAARVVPAAPFAPDACLINRYAPGARLALHQDRDEARFDAPIVSVSLGLPAKFLWGGPARLNFHAIAPLREGHHSQTGSARFNLTLRRALAPAASATVPIGRARADHGQPD